MRVHTLAILGMVLAGAAACQMAPGGYSTGSGYTTPAAAPAPKGTPGEKSEHDNIEPAGGNAEVGHSIGPR